MLEDFNTLPLSDWSRCFGNNGSSWTVRGEDFSLERAIFIELDRIQLVTLSFRQCTIVVEHKLVMNPADYPQDKVLVLVIEMFRNRTFGQDVHEFLDS